MSALVLLLLLHGSASGGGGAQIGVVGRVSRTWSRWGGAMPTREEQARWAIPAPYAGKVLLFRRGDENSDAPPVAEVTSGADGAFSVALPPGRYCVVGADKRHLRRGAESPGRYSDARCLAARQRQCDHHVDVKRGMAPLELVFHEGGRPPCYHGPSPPSAAPRTR